MADFAMWATAAERALGWSPGEFMAAYQGNRDSANDLAIESSIVGQPLVEYLESNGAWNGSASELLEALEQNASEQAKRQKIWPKNGRSLAGQLKRLAPNLRLAGWEVSYHREASQRSWVIRRRSPAEMQTNADWCSPALNDVPDANDTLAQTSPERQMANEFDYEEGIL